MRRRVLLQSCGAVGADGGIPEPESLDLEGLEGSTVNVPRCKRLLVLAVGFGIFAVGMG